MLEESLPQSFGSYDLVERLAQGGMAVIYRARTRGPHGFAKEVVIKKILPSLSGHDEFVTQFLDEARIAGSMTHPNIVQIYDVGQVDSDYYIAMEYVRGKHLGQVIRQVAKNEQSFPPSVALRILSDVASGLAFAHSAIDPSGHPLNIIHRDISPQNILIGFNGAVKLTDFGIAKAANKLFRTSAGVLKGKFAYMAPEQILGAEANKRTDLFSLGIVLWETLSGRRLFYAESDAETLRRVRKCEVPPLSVFVPDIDEELERTVGQLLESNPDNRYRDAPALIDDISRYLASGRISTEFSQVVRFMAGLFPDEAPRHAWLPIPADGETEAPGPGGAPEASRVPPEVADDSQKGPSTRDLTKPKAASPGPPGDVRAPVASLNPDKTAGQVHVVDGPEGPVPNPVAPSPAAMEQIEEYLGRADTLAITDLSLPAILHEGRSDDIMETVREPEHLSEGETERRMDGSIPPPQGSPRSLRESAAPGDMPWSFEPAGETRRDPAGYRDTSRDLRGAPDPDQPTATRREYRDPADTSRDMSGPPDTRRDMPGPPETRRDLPGVPSSPGSGSEGGAGISGYESPPPGSPREGGGVLSGPLAGDDLDDTGTNIPLGRKATQPMVGAVGEDESPTAAGNGRDGASVLGGSVESAEPQDRTIRSSSMEPIPMGPPDTHRMDGLAMEEEFDEPATIIDGSSSGGLGPQYGWGAPPGSPPPGGPSELPPPDEQPPPGPEPGPGQAWPSPQAEDQQDHPVVGEAPDDTTPIPPRSKLPIVLLVLVLLGVIGGGGWWLYLRYFTAPMTLVSPVSMKRGSLVVFATPGTASVIVNGVGLDPGSPAKIGGLVPGLVYKVVVKAKGWTTALRDVKLKPGETRTLEVTLVRTLEKKADGDGDGDDS